MPYGDISPAAAIAAERLAIFVDLSRTLDERIDALIDERLRLSDRIAFMQGLDDELRQFALRVCDNPPALDHWAGIGNPTERHIVASNRLTEVETLQHLTQDRDQSIRAAVAAHPYADLDVLAALLGDASPDVQAALNCSDAMLTPIDDEVNDEPGSDDTLGLLHEMVEAAVVFDCLDQLQAEERQRLWDQIVVSSDRHLDEPHAETDSTEDAVPIDPPSSIWQAIGLLRSRLGALDESEVEAEHADLQRYCWLIANEPPSDESCE